MTVTAQLSATSASAVTVPFTVTGTATNGTDYTITASPITIAAGSTTGTATITITSDTLDEPNETVVLTMGTPTNANLGTTTVHTATITDDDPTPTVQWSTASQASANETGTMTVTAQLSAASGQTVTVPFSVSGTATNGTDYTITASPITLAAGSTTGTATITITSDTLVEGNESVILTMGSPTNATLGTTTVHTATITDDDSAPVNSTAAGTATAVAGSSKTIDVSAPYTNDTNANNTCLVEYKLSTAGTYTTWQTLAHAASPYATTITGLAENTAYNVRVTYQDADTVTGTAQQVINVTTPVYVNPLMHSGANLGTKYSAGTWGAGKDCSWCHSGNTTNVKQIAAQIDTPTGLRSVVFNRMTASVTTATGTMGNDQRSPLTKSDHVCEVCHHQTDFHQYSSSVKTVGKSVVATNHNNRTDCVTCHAHSKGFLASCASCHAGDGGPVTTSPTNALGAATGAHAKHTGATPTNLSMKCEGCHNGYTTSPMGDNRIELGFNINATNYPNGFNGTVTGGSFVGTNTLTAPYAWRAVAPTTNTVAAAKDVTCSVYCHGGWANSGNTTPSWTSATALTCGSCHFTSANPPAAAGDHAAHLALTGSLAVTCANCHPSGSYTNQHLDGNVEWSLSGAKFNATSKYKTGLTGSTNAVAPSGTYGSCATTNCHGQLSPAWGGAVGTTGQCQKCHGSQSVAFLTVTSAQVAPGTGNIDTGRATGVTARGGMHQEHLKGTAGISEPVKCSECHVKVSAITDAGHMNYSTATITFGGTATNTANNPHTPTVSRVSGVITCNNTYCHTANRQPGTAAGQSGINTPPVWNNAALIGGTTIADTCTNKCHAMPPGSGVANDTHQAYAAVTTPAGLSTCSSQSPATGCHPTINAAPTSMLTIWFNKLLHINGVVDGGTCVGCHSKVITRTIGRAAGKTLANVVAEMNTAGNWSHKRSASYSVVDADCIVCHLEGDSQTGKPNPSYHKDGNIDLRDPDNIAASENRITNMSGAAYTFTRFSTSFAAGTRTTTGHTANTIDNIITQKFCVACHDSDGALSSRARVASGTQYKPFNTTISGTGYVTPLSAGVAGGVVDVKTQLLTSNSSFHPVLGPNNNSYVTGTRIAAPYGVTKTNGTPSVGVVMTCHDCHNVVGTPLTTRTVTAHGNAVTLRGSPVAKNATTAAPLTTAPTAANQASDLCMVCHLTYSQGTYYGHNTGSAFSSNTGRSTKGPYIQWGCNMCHSSGYTTAVIRPVRGADVHGNNALPTTAGTKTGRWNNTSMGTPALANNRPYAFIRNINQLADHCPKTIGTTTYTASQIGCDMRTSPCSQGLKTYLPGGVF